ncbi:hypothetical protein ADL26_15130, partial [Thermoactinomyces vulgaris]
VDLQQVEQAGCARFVGHEVPAPAFRQEPVRVDGPPLRWSAGPLVVDLEPHAAAQVADERGGGDAAGVAAEPRPVVADDEVADGEQAVAGAGSGDFAAGAVADCFDAEAAALVLVESGERQVLPFGRCEAA